MMFSVVLAFAYLSTASGIRATTKQGLHPTLWKTTGGGHGMRKIIHQTWKTNQLPGMFKNWSESWKACLPDWEYRLHTDEDNRALIAEHFPDVLATYDAYGNESGDLAIRRVDAAKYAYLAIEGGLYVDLDMECLRDPTPLFKKMEDGVSHFLVREDDTKGKNEYFTISNSIMGTDGPSKFFARLVGSLPAGSLATEASMASGTYFLTEKAYEPAGLYLDDWNENETENIVRKGKAGVLLGHEKQFLGPGYYDLLHKKKCLKREKCLELYPNAYSVSHWTDVWNGKKVPPA